MIKFVRVCDSSVKDFNAGRGLLKVQGLNFEIDYNIENAIDVEVNGVATNAKLVDINNGLVKVDIDDLTNVTKAQRKDLKNGVIESVKGKYNGIECYVMYDKIEKEFYIKLDLQVVLYN